MYTVEVAAAQRQKIPRVAVLGPLVALLLGAVGRTWLGGPLENLVETEVLRGILAPVGHGLWTAILGGVLLLRGLWRRATAHEQAELDVVASGPPSSPRLTSAAKRRRARPPLRPLPIANRAVPPWRSARSARSVGVEETVMGTTKLTRWRRRMRLPQGRTRSAAGLMRGPRPGTEDRVAAASPAAALPRAGRRDLAPRLAALAALAAGVLNLVSALLPAQQQRLDLLDRLVPGMLSEAATVVTAAAGVGLVLLAGGLRRRRRTAWLAAVILLGGSAVLHLLKGLDFEEAVVLAFAAGLLAGQGGRFTARAGPGDRRVTAVAGLAVIGITAGYGALGLLANRPDVVEDLSVTRVFGEVGRMALGLGGSLTLTGRFGRFFPSSVAAVFWLGVLVVAARALAPTLVRRQADPGLRLAVAAADDSLAYFALRDDRATVRAADTLVSYRPVGTVALAAGDPLGPCQEWPQAGQAFLAEAAAQGRIAAVLGCGERAAKVWAAAGLTTLYLGDEAVLDLVRFSLEGRAVRIARQSWNRARRAGFTTLACRSGDLDPDTVASLRELSRRWRGEAAERGFSMALGRLFDPRDGGALVVVAHDAASHPVGFLHLVPWGTDGASLDVMRRDRDSPGYLNDFLVVEAARGLPALGVRRLSLNFSFLRAVLAAGAEPRVRLRLRAARWLLHRLSGPFQIETLYRFNKKFAPAWQPRYLAVEAPEELPRVVIAVLRAEGLLPAAPWRLARLRPHHPVGREEALSRPPPEPPAPRPDRG